LTSPLSAPFILLSGLLAVYRGGYLKQLTPK
jgi:hypothetical protein